jgi:hypothetical protein
LAGLRRCARGYSSDVSARAARCARLDQRLHRVGCGGQDLQLAADALAGKDHRIVAQFAAHLHHRFARGRRHVSFDRHVVLCRAPRRRRVFGTASPVLEGRDRVKSRTAAADSCRCARIARVLACARSGTDARHPLRPSAAGA